ncbi:hypothetical protein M758_10G144300 [Ceratodon purpureus]|uniref:Secreted protein n=1 Tax=Ceratodon purpureus TaxID=3225 RepID=A0A8T0GM27_CERPU|nr:hypothetical protein KC19_10G150000 [Ceratodon purpureus]KAG0604094.1 hypothetical protein M758_10G144300 [Ceratodon purpureus]
MWFLCCLISWIVSFCCCLYHVHAGFMISGTSSSRSERRRFTIEIAYGVILVNWVAGRTNPACGLEVMLVLT